MKYLKNLVSYLTSEWALDKRALALMRIGIASVLIGDWLVSVFHLTAFYTDEGVLPLSFLFSSTITWNPAFISFHVISGNKTVQIILFGVTLFFYLLYCIGYQTRLAALGSWVMLISMQNRNILIDQGGDHLLRSLVFWSIFLPTHHYYSVDAVKKKYDNSQNYFGISVIGYLLVIFTLYYFSVFQKNGEDWRNGSAVYYALSLDMITYPSAQKFFFQFPGLMKFLTFFTYYWEMLAPFLLWIPIGKGILRLIFWISLVCFHGSLAFCFMIGIFIYTPILGFVGILPSSVMNIFDAYIGKHIHEFMQKITALFSKIEQLFHWKLYLSTTLQETRRMLSLYVSAIVIWLQFAWKLHSLNIIELLEPIPQIILAFRFDQTVGMFAPTVFRDDGWYILEATSANDSLKTDIWNNKYPVSYEKPHHVPDTYRNDRWRKYLENYLFVSKSSIRPYFCSYMLRKAQREYPEKNITSLEVVFMKETSVPYGETPTVIREVLCQCH
ncbi:MAG: hypothetical protein NZM38_07340 [Cytophagales bacterium]|nr:hypothetical protein [Cytophagales bacterium]MDW8384571.1 hypothetical protein [Flammeovirgaceae bacterium]